MSTKFAPPYTCILLGKVEEDVWNKEEILPWIWLRYIDDVFFVWIDSEENLKIFLDRLNNFHPSLKFTYETSREKVNFLDLSVSVKDNEFVTDLFCKPTDCHQYLEYSSAHPKHCRNSIIYSQAVRVKRICSSEKSFMEHMKSLKSWFVKRRYPKSLIESQIERVMSVKREDLFKRGRRKVTGVPLVVTFHPLFDKLSSVLKNNLHLLHSDKEVQKVFSPPPFVSFRTARNIKNHLVRAKVYPLKRTKGSSKCNKPRCQTCINMCSTDMFASFTRKEVYKINHHLNCDDKCIVYLLSCRVCGIQYVGQTTDKFRFRWNNYKSSHRKASEGGHCMQKSFHDHYLSEDHNGLIADCEITLIDKTDGSDPTKRENYWIRKLKTYYPQGLNIVEE